MMCCTFTESSPTATTRASDPSVTRMTLPSSNTTVALPSPVRRKEPGFIFWPGLAALHAPLAVFVWTFPSREPTIP